ncbi:MAG: hypothetical protein ACYTFG_16865, partial [Planctomycetota bacterium]
EDAEEQIYEVVRVTLVVFVPDADGEEESGLERPDDVKGARPGDRIHIVRYYLKKPGDGEDGSLSDSG